MTKPTIISPYDENSVFSLLRHFYVSSGDGTHLLPCFSKEEIDQRSREASENIKNNGILDEETTQQLFLSAPFLLWDSTEGDAPCWNGKAVTRGKNWEQVLWEAEFEYILNPMINLYGTSTIIKQRALNMAIGAFYARASILHHISILIPNEALVFPLPIEVFIFNRYASYYFSNTDLLYPGNIEKLISDYPDLTRYYQDSLQNEDTACLSNEEERRPIFPENFSVFRFHVNYNSTKND